jgi:peptidyl-prolyl cis-trans isomerase SurA
MEKSAMIKKIIYLSISYLAICSSLAWAAQPPAAVSPEPIVPVNRIVAIVNDEVISQSDLDLAIAQLQQQILAAKLTMPPTEKLREDALEQLINYRLQIQMATRNNLQATPSEIDQALQQIAQGNHLTVDQLKEQLTLEHTTYEDFRKKVADQLMITKLQQQLVMGQVKVTDADVEDFKKTPQGPREYKVVDFFLPVSEQPSAEELDKALTTAHNIQQQIDSGVAIDKITPAYQDLGWRTARDLPQLFADQLPGLKINSASAPIRAPNGYHVLELLETRTGNQKLTDDQIRQLLLRQKYETAVKAAITKARKEAYVQIIPQ